MKINKKAKLLTSLSFLGVATATIVIPLTTTGCAETTNGKYFKAPFTNELYKKLFTQINAITKLNGSVPISDAKKALNTPESRKALADSLLNIDVDGVTNVDVTKNSVSLSLAKIYFLDTTEPLQYGNSTLSINNSKIILTPIDSQPFFADDPAPFSFDDAKKLYNAINKIVKLDNTIRMEDARNKLQDKTKFNEIKQDLGIKPDIESISVVDRRTISISLSARAYGNQTVQFNNINFKNKNNIITLVTKTEQIFLFADNLVSMTQKNATDIMTKIDTNTPLNNTIRLSEAKQRLDNNQSLISEIKTIISPNVNINSINVLNAKTIEIKLDKQYYTGVLDLGNGLIVTNADKKITLSNNQNDFFLADLVDFTENIANNLLKEINNISSLDKRLTIDEANLKLNGQNVFDKIKTALEISYNVNSIQATSLNTIVIELSQIPFNNKTFEVSGVRFTIDNKRIELTSTSNFFILKFDANIAVNLTNALSGIVSLDKKVRITAARELLQKPTNYQTIANSISNQISVNNVQIEDIGTISITIDKPIFAPIIQVFNNGIRFSVVNNLIQLSKLEYFFLNDLPLFTQNIANTLFDMISKQAKLDGTLKASFVNDNYFNDGPFRVKVTQTLIKGPPIVLAFVFADLTNPNQILVYTNDSNFELFQPTQTPLQVNDQVSISVDSTSKMIHIVSKTPFFKA